MHALNNIPSISIELGVYMIRKISRNGMLLMNPNMKPSATMCHCIHMNLSRRIYRSHKIKVKGHRVQFVIKWNEIYLAAYKKWLYILYPSYSWPGFMRPQGSEFMIYFIGVAEDHSTRGMEAIVGCNIFPCGIDMNTNICYFPKP